MTEDVFIRTIRNRFFLRGIRRVVQLPNAQSWKPPKGYSFDLETAENHRSESCRLFLSSMAVLHICL